jgi:very-short-patch-repair endonuclease
MEEIQMQLEQYQRQHPELQPLLREDGPEGFFVKNLENVQGDERDVIILSIGYGPDASGRFAYNFGPLTQEGGERRLNVAITRARQRVKVVASFRPEQIDLTRVTKDGTKLLRQYLEFAERGPAVLAAPLIREDGEPESPFEEAVAAALRQRGLNIVSQVGIGPYRIDLAIKDEATGRYVLGIECDGATYHRSPTARDRDRLRQEVLERLGWRIHRIWSTNWLKDPAGEVERVLAALASARQGLTR